MKKILVPTDFSPNALKALDYAVQIAKQTKGEVLIIHASELPDTSFSNENSYEADLANKMMLEKKGQLEMLRKTIIETEPVSVTTKFFPGTVADSILNGADEFQADLIVMGTAGNSGIKEKIFGSKTAAIVGKSNIPVLAIPLLSEWALPRKILVAINNADSDEDVLNPVFELAKSFNASVQVAIFTDTDDDFVEDYDMHERNIEILRDRLKNHFKDIDVHAVHLAGHHFMENLQNWIENNSINIVTMLTHKRTILGSIFNRSMTKKLSYHTNIPLLAIPV